MLRALYDYGVSHPEILNTPGCARRTVNYIVDLTGSGDFIGLRKSADKKLVCPSVAGANVGRNPVCNPVMERASVSIGMDPGKTGKAMEVVEARRECFLEYFRDGASDVPGFDSVLRALTDDVILSKILDAAEDAEVKDTSVVAFSVDGVLLTDVPELKTWWGARHAAGPSGTGLDTAGQAIDVVTGEACTPARLFRQIPPEAVGGASVASLICFNNNAFESYGMKDGQCRNVPMAQTTADVIADAVTYLGIHAPYVGGLKFLHWYDTDLPEGGDVLNTVLFDLDGADPDALENPDGLDVKSRAPVSEGAMNAAADRLVRSPFTGECPADLSDRRYHILILQAQAYRVTVLRHMTDTYASLYANLKAWFDDLSLVGPNGTGRMRPRAFNKLLYSLLTKGETSRTTGNKFAPVSFLVAPTMRACIEGGPVPDAVAARALAANLSRIYADGSASPMAVQLLKLWLCRRNRAEGKEEIMPDSNETRNPAYYCGWLMALYEKVQAVVMPDVNAGVMTRFYGACSESPALVLGNLQALSVHHFDKMTSVGYKTLLTAALEETWGCIEGPIPARLTMEGKAYFALGYWQGRADLNRRIADMKAEWERKKAEKAAKDAKNAKDGGSEEDASIMAV